MYRTCLATLFLIARAINLLYAHEGDRKPNKMVIIAPVS